MATQLPVLHRGVQLLCVMFLCVAGVMVITTEMGVWSGQGGDKSPILVERVHLLKSFGSKSDEVAFHLKELVEEADNTDTTADEVAVSRLGFGYAEFAWATDICNGGIVLANSSDDLAYSGSGAGKKKKLYKYLK